MTTEMFVAQNRRKVWSGQNLKKNEKRECEKATEGKLTQVR